MKPDPYLVVEALRRIDAAANDCVLVGDSVSDVEAGLAARVVVVGLAKTAERGNELKRAGAAALLSRT